MNTVKKIGHVSLALLLASLTCFGPATMTAFAEEQDPGKPNESVVATTSPDDQEVVETVNLPQESTATHEQAASERTEDIVAGEYADAALEQHEETATLASITNDAAKEGSVAPLALSVEGAEESADAEKTEADEMDETDSHTFNISTMLELMDAFKYDINSQSNESFVINLTNDITLEKPTDRFDTHGKRLVVGTDRLLVKNGNTVTIHGNGHTLTYTSKSTTNLSLGAGGGHLILGNADGSDSLIITFQGTTDMDPLLTIVNGGTGVINPGVTLSNNANHTGLVGGAVTIQSNGVLTMNGGIIENSHNTSIPYGGAVAVDGGTFYMNGGVIKGNYEPDSASGYQGAGGGVAVAPHGTASSFVMSGNAVIQGNTAKYGGGVYVGQNGSFTMSDNAAILNNTATLYGGGVYVEKSGTFTMGENNVIQGNNAQHGGGILNFGTAVVTNVFDNDASVAGADIYNGGTITMEDVKDEWSLSREQSTSDPSYVPVTDTSTPTDDSRPDLAPITFLSLAAEPEATAADSTASTISTNPSSKAIDGWYYDGHRETGETDADGNAVVEKNRWNANEDTADVPQYLQSYVVSGQPTNEVMGLKAAHNANAASEIPHTINVIWENYDGAELFTLEKVDAEHIPAATEYEELSGHENPTEPADENNKYEFEGWDKSIEPNGDVIYTAEYDAVPKGADTPDTHEQTPDDPQPQPEPESPEPDPQPQPEPKSPDPQPEPEATEPETHQPVTNDPEPVPALPSNEENSDGTTENQVKDFLPQTGDQIARAVFGIGFVALGAAGITGLAAYKMRTQRKENR